MKDLSIVKKPAPLQNVALFAELIERVVERDLDMPGLACFYGYSGLGKTKSAVYGANRYRAAYVECGQYTTAKSLLVSILAELGIARPRGNIADLITETIRLLAADIRRPVIVDEAHHIAHRRFVDVLRELHDKSLAPIILIGEETLPVQLAQFERVHNRMLDWVPAQPCNRTDFGLLAKSYCPDIQVSEDLTGAILDATRGNTRRIVVNLARAKEIAYREDTTGIDLAAFGGTSAIVTGRAPTPRKGMA